MTVNIDRRKFLGSAVASGAFTLVPRRVLGGAGHVAPSERINIAHIGMGTQSFRELGGLLDEPSVQIVAICDPNTYTNDYVEWGKGGIRNRIRQYLDDSSWGENIEGCPGGREIGKKVVDTYYANRGRKGGGKGCAVYSDFREMLEKEKDVDAVKIMTPDHLHAALSVAAMKKGKHVLMHKPIANRLHEGRVVLKTARKTKVATHLLAYGSGAANGLIVDRIKEGAVGPLREIHNWTNRPVWPQYAEIPTDRPPVPKGFDWDLWLGPEKHRPYHPHYTHSVYRGWYDFGGGSMADMGIYSLWPVFTGLELGAPLSAQAWQTHTCTVEDNVSKTVKNDWAYPIGCSQRFRFAARKNMPELDLFWYDGGMKPRLPDEVEAHDVQMGREGILYVGDDGIIMASFHGRDPEIFAKGQRKPFRAEGPSVDRTASWLNAFKGGKQSPGSFLNAGAITDAVNLGTVALRAGRKVLFDSKNMKITNAPDAEKYLYRDYRKGWEM